MNRASLLLILVAAPALATDAFPAAIQTKYMLPDLHPELCAMCHTNGITGAGTVNTLFGRAMRMRGLMPNDATSLNAALDALATEAVDSDGDGVTDVAELMASRSPNVAQPRTGGGAGGGTGGGTGGEGGGGQIVTPPPPPRFGCGAAVVPELLFFAAFLPLLRSRRRKPC